MNKIVLALVIIIAMIAGTALSIDVLNKCKEKHSTMYCLLTLKAQTAFRIWGID